MLFRSLIALILGLTAPAAFAQPPGGPPPGFDVDRLAVLLDLDAYQKGELDRVLEEQRAAMAAERRRLNDSDQRPSFEEMRARREQQQQETLAKLRNVLTELQMEKLKLLMEPGPGGFGPGLGGRNRPPGGL